MYAAHRNRNQKILYYPKHRYDTAFCRLETTEDNSQCNLTTVISTSTPSPNSFAVTPPSHNIEYIQEHRPVLTYPGGITMLPLCSCILKTLYPSLRDGITTLIQYLPLPSRAVCHAPLWIMRTAAHTTNQFANLPSNPTTHYKLILTHLTLYDNTPPLPSGCHRLLCL